MIVDSAAFSTFMTPRRVLDRKGGPKGGDMRASIERRYAAYKKLREIKGQVLRLTPITETDTEVWFDVEHSPIYETISAAVARDLVWNTHLKGIDYNATLTRWCQMLEHDRIPEAQVALIQSNDLSLPEFGDFKITLMEYLIGCERRDGKYFRLSGFKAFTQSD